MNERGEEGAAWALEKAAVELAEVMELRADEAAKAAVELAEVMELRADEAAKKRVRACRSKEPARRRNVKNARDAFERKRECGCDCG
jgi:hypothetical protein